MDWLHFSLEVRMAKPLLCLAFFCASLCWFAASAAGLRLELVHIDARDSRTGEERVRRAIERTHRRLASMGVVAAPVRWSETQYITEYLIGDPPQRAEAIVDTGSDLIWTQCAACRPGCFGQYLPHYNTSRSRTAQAVPCDGAACAVVSPETRCSTLGGSGACTVAVSYGAGDIVGLLGTEVFTFRSEKVSLAFGCVTASRLTPGSLDGASGIIGLGRGALSLVPRSATPSSLTASRPTSATPSTRATCSSPRPPA
jgi:hypothetical protein